MSTFVEAQIIVYAVFDRHQSHKPTGSVAYQEVCPQTRNAPTVVLTLPRRQQLIRHLYVSENEKQTFERLLKVWDRDDP